MKNQLKNLASLAAVEIEEKPDREVAPTPKYFALIGKRGKLVEIGRSHGWVVCIRVAKYVEMLDKKEIALGETPAISSIPSNYQVNIHTDDIDSYENADLEAVIRIFRSDMDFAAKMNARHVSGGGTREFNGPQEGYSGEGFRDANMWGND